MTDWQRVVAYFRTHPGASRGEAQQALGWIHVTARMSDARARGIEFDKVRDDKGVWRYWVRGSRLAPMSGVQTVAFG